MNYFYFRRYEPLDFIDLSREFNRWNNIQRYSYYSLVWLITLNQFPLRYPIQKVLPMSKVRQNNPSRNAPKLSDSISFLDKKHKTCLREWAFSFGLICKYIIATKETLIANIQTKDNISFTRKMSLQIN